MDDNSSGRGEDAFPSAFFVDGYRSFAGRTEVELRPLTILFGYNSSGKSALLRFLPLLSDSIGYAGLGPLDLSSEAIRGASFRELAHNGSAGFSFGLSWRQGFTADFRFDLRELPDRRRHVVERMLARGMGGELTLELDLERGTDDLSRYVPTIDGKTFPGARISFNGLTPQLQESGPEDSDDLVQWIRSIEFHLRPLAYRITWLKAVREVPARWEVFRGPASGLEPDGSGAIQMLASESTEIEAAVSDWYQTATRHRAILQRGGYLSQELVSLGLSPLGSAHVVPIADTGEGMAQVLPVVTLLSMALKGRLASAPILAVEHPELHLHPAVHQKLAELFCRAAESGTIQSIVETHSENFLLGVQLAIAKGMLAPKNLRLLWVRQDGGDGYAEPIELDRLGRPVGDVWPPGMFSENIDLAKELATLRRKLSE